MATLIPFTPAAAPVTTEILITAGERDPICPRGRRGRSKPGSSRRGQR